jgi:hypothetical protein
LKKENGNFFFLLRREEKDFGRNSSQHHKNILDQIYSSFLAKKNFLYDKEFYSGQNFGLAKSQ